ncbi:hypothetical protein ACOSQ3_004867 [Xanthoceras sorbifolium]
MFGWSTKRRLACPCCAKKINLFSLANGSKICYIGHRRFLPKDHVWRNQMSQFNGKKEIGDSPKLPTGDEKGRGKAKGVPNNHNLEVVREISILFSQRETLFARFKEIKFAYTCTEEELKVAMLKTCSFLFKDWMLLLRKPIFKKYLTKKARKAHSPDNVPIKVWEKMVDKWMDEGWQILFLHKNCLKMHHTASLVSIAKYKYEQIKDDGEEWASEHTEALYVCITFYIQFVFNFFKLFRKASHGQVLSMGSGIKAMDVYGCCKESCKRARVDKNWKYIAFANLFSNVKDNVSFNLVVIQNFVFEKQHFH